MWRQTKWISFFYTRPFFNRFFIHSPSKWIIYVGLATIAIAMYFSENFGQLLFHAGLGARLMLLIGECIFVGLLRGMNTLTQQMYSDRLLTLFHVSGVSPFRMIIGQSTSSLPLYTWSSIMIAIPLTIGYSALERILYGVLFLIVSLFMIWLTDIMSRFLMVLTMRFVPIIVKTFVGISSLAYVALISLLVWALIRIETISAEAWQDLERGMIYVLCFFLVGLGALFLFSKQIGKYYYESWLNHAESLDRTRPETQENLSNLVKSAYDAIVFKDVTMLIRNPITKIRFWFWLIAIICGAVIGRSGMASSFLTEANQSFYVLMFVSLLTALIFGEIVSALYQLEEQNYILYYVAAVKGSTIFWAKTMTASLLVVGPAVIGHLVLAIVLQFSLMEWLVGALLVLGFTFGSVIVQLSIASLDKKGRDGVNLKEGSDEEEMLKQSPKKPIAILSSILGLIYLGLCIWLYWINIGMFILVTIVLLTLLLSLIGVRYSAK
ncbi:hypothetical protein EEL31_23630 [Brevibacillus laterosporus]|uniref:Uncharacterized protein n=1 Tax=Brevibacillus laterosporus TaxID=1465 RepID=A0A518V719_BRELA|nr:hypothetical protein [Brevibacillus laterosporus]QDX92817.1 hypothetical protein EEL30_11170 [Brevibacillus laterosporus]TPG71127.1 hypothetical protein EEL31_23630 [Brevibacillus laterosporus]